MNFTKVFHGEKRLKDMYVGASRWQVFKFRAIRAIKRVLLALLFASIGGWTAGGMISWAYHMRPITVYAERVVEVAPSGVAPVLKRIAACESEGSQKAANGQITYHANTDGSLDVGKYQINLKYYGKKATELNLDLTKESDNEKMAEWIYANRGTSDWSASAGCWNK